MDHSATVRRTYDLLSAGDVDGFTGVLTDDFVEHETLPGGAPGKEGTRAFFRGFIVGFPDLRITPEDVFSSGDKVVARAIATGTNEGPFMGMPPTGKAIRVQLIDRGPESLVASTEPVLATQAGSRGRHGRRPERPVQARTGWTTAIRIAPAEHSIPHRSSSRRSAP